MAKYITVAAVIPAYNAAGTLQVLLDDLVKQKYDEIIVLDDASTDDTAKITRNYKSKIRLIEGRNNVGSGANRNRIIGQTSSNILHFIDADMRLKSINTPDIIRQLHWPENTAYIGGLIRNPDSEQNPFNFGPRPGIVTSLTSLLQYAIWLIGLRQKKLAAILRNLAQPILRSWPNIYTPQKRRNTFWTAESNMIIKREIFEGLGGYDPRFRYSEIGDFATRAHRLGLKTYFDPRIDLLHTTMDNIYLRRAQKRKAYWQFVGKHGYLAFAIPRLDDYLAGRKTQKRNQ